MINRLCKKLNHSVEVRQSLSSLRQEIKDPDKKELLLSWIQDGDLNLTAFLSDDDAKTRKNADLLIGELALSSCVPALFSAYQKEETLFVRESYLTAMQSMDASFYLSALKERFKELSSYKPVPEEQKHIEKELHALSDLILSMEPYRKHPFRSGRQTFHCLLRTNPLYPEITQQQLSDAKTSVSRLGVQVKTNHLNRLLPIRTWQELLFQVPGMTSSKADPDTIAKTIAKSELLNLLSNTHDGDFPFFFRIDIKSKMSLSDRSRFAQKTAQALERYTDRKLMNSTSYYELELRLIEGKSGIFYLLTKFHTIKDHRFEYRQEYIPTSIKPVNAALLVELAKDYMVPDAQILDPFCGVGTMLIERQKAIKGNTSYGIDHSPEAIEKAIRNTQNADQIIHYINKDCFTFTHQYAFDEIFTEMPYASGKKSEAEIFEVYEKFFPFARKLLTPEGTIIMYTRNRDYVKKLCTKQNFQMIREFKISEKPETWLTILK